MKFRADMGDVFAGLIITVIGGAFLIGGLDYRMGTVVRMGPGYLPVSYGVITVFLGLVITLLALGRSGETPHPSVRSVLAVLGSIASFGVLLPTFGLIPAILATVMIATRGDRDARLAPSVILAVTVAVAAWLVFIEVLGLPMQAFRLPR
jgi:hypothetical protein